MKKLITGILTLALVLSVSTVAVSAAGGRHGRRAANVDKRNDCGYYNADCQFTDSDGDGVCDLCGLGTCHGGEGCGANFTDEDGDGICDLCGREVHAAGSGCGANFTDEDGDGVCDNRTSNATRTGRGLGRGRCGGRGRFCR